MPTVINVYQRFAAQNGQHVTRRIHSYYSSIVPQSGNLLEISPYGYYEVVQVIHRETEVALEVKPYNNPQLPVITTLNHV